LIVQKSSSMQDLFQARVSMYINLTYNSRIASKAKDIPCHDKHILANDNAINNTISVMGCYFSVPLCQWHIQDPDGTVRQSFGTASTIAHLWHTEITITRNHDKKS
jgi:hypothetical protein